MYALYTLGIERIIATNAVGAINRNFKPSDIVIPHDFVDFTKFRITTFYDKAPVTHIDVSTPYCPEMRGLLIANSKKVWRNVWDNAVLVCTDGPRFETPAEIEMFRCLGGDVVGMTTIPEVLLARELELCYASICFVSNMAAGIQKSLSHHEISKLTKQIQPAIEQILMKVIEAVPTTLRHLCPCPHALSEARLN
jgi:5'-methylthioadenosine phosphorylase